MHCSNISIYKIILIILSYFKLIIILKIISKINSIGHCSLEITRSFELLVLTYILVPFGKCNFLTQKILKYVTL